MGPLEKQQQELIKIYEKLPSPKREEVLDFVKWIWREKPKKKVSLEGALGNIEVTEEDIEDAKRSVFPFDYEK